MKAILLILLLTTSLIIQGQEKIDSLRQLLSDMPEVNDAYIDVLNELTFELMIAEPVEGIEMANQALKLADSLGYEKGIFTARMHKGSALWTSGLLDQSLEYYLSARAMDLKEIERNKIALNNNIAEVFKQKEQFDSAQFYYERAIEYAAENFPELKLSMVYSNLGELFLLKNQVDSSRKYFLRGLEGGLAMKTNRGIAYAHFGLAEVESREGKYQEAVGRHHLSLKIREAIPDQRGIMLSSLKLGELHDKLGHPDSAIFYFDRAESLALANRSSELLSESYRLRSEHLANLSDFRSALKYSKKYQVLQDSISNANFLSSLASIKNALLAELNASENDRLRADKESQRISSKFQLVMVIAITVTVLLILLVTYQIRLRRLTRKFTEHNRQMIETILAVLRLNLADGLETFLNETLRLSNQAIGSGRVILWEIKDEEGVMKPAYVWPNEQHANLSRDEVVIPKLGKYFQRLQADRVLAIDNVFTDPAASEFDKDYLKKNAITSTLDGEVRLDKNPIGVLSFEQMHKYRKWNQSEKRFVTTLSSIISMAFVLQQNERLIADLMAKNAQLTSSSYMVSHHLREPLSQILGFCSLARLDQKMEQDEAWTHVDKAAKEIDQVIWDVSSHLGEKMN